MRVMEDSRTSHRSRALKPGRVVLTEWTVLDCTIRDLTDAGARLEFGTAMELPAEFRLQIGATRATRNAKLAWQRGLAAGVLFPESRQRRRVTDTPA
jgi:hypothetical protein